MPGTHDSGPVWDIEVNRVYDAGDYRPRTAMGAHLIATSGQARQATERLHELSREAEGLRKKFSQVKPTVMMMGKGLRVVPVEPTQEEIDDALASIRRAAGNA